MFRALVFSVLATTAQVGPLQFVDDPAACTALRSGEGGNDVISAVADGAMILTRNGMDAIEYYCEFAPAIVFDWTEDASTQVRLGFCEEPGPYITPTVFAFRMYSNEPNLVYVHEGEASEGHVFSLCP